MEQHARSPTIGSKNGPRTASRRGCRLPRRRSSERGDDPSRERAGAALPRAGSEREESDDRGGPSHRQALEKSALGPSPPIFQKILPGFFQKNLAGKIVGVVADNCPVTRTPSLGCRGNYPSGGSRRMLLIDDFLNLPIIRGPLCRAGKPFPTPSATALPPRFCRQQKRAGFAMQPWPGFVRRTGAAKLVACI